ncbi:MULTISPECIES: NAD(P)-binding domain-containing protein [unclassified Nocardioides]|uniref:NAD(P)-binding domain-containing protein n=1 Tax=unclassified Nocardioides TaxID=2615069 RepID=UPI0009EFED20|nr:MULTISPECIES: pyrroline-5-carboxylate reductase dimerization domain-containing protein [unclassified Nocardioides]GAW48137.1 NADP oxidoreductase coenzyme F420-dependent (Pre cursor) [Nocardioides sp. PD653-B2]GAW53393.1 NADP oxidoreductase coenzyme F420-dependent (Pre cursor) [Nocardioides sp. PD653]
MTTETPTYGVLGVGSIAAAVVVGLCEGVEQPPDVVLSPRNAGRAADLAARFDTVTVAADNQAVVDGADVVLVAVLPQQVAAVLGDLEFADRHAVVSVVAGVSLDDLRRWVAPATRVARSVPLPAVARREGVTPVFPPLPEAVTLFDGLGGAIAVEDAAAYEALTVSSATVAAHYAFLGAIADWLVGHGISEAQARRYVAATYVGAAESLRADPVDFDALIAEVATPGGLNERFARRLREAGALDAVGAGMDEVLARLLE